ncbi:ATP-binding protein [Streptomyces sp. NPDC048290]|uniref:ATP-binding protein n=1 Tax=Streptomyces sp. NPDC048290 TaxID=3155811 RepID=UPI00342A7C60
MHEYTSTVRVWGLICPGFLEEVSRARRWTRDVLRDSPLVDDAVLIVSELSANAILHTASGRQSGTFHLALAVSPLAVAVSVIDEGGSLTTPHPKPPSGNAVHGRGLRMVSALAHRVHVRSEDGSHTVTAELLAGVGRC